MNCKNCGAPLRGGAKFCAGCGQTVRTADVPAMGYQQNPYIQNPTPQNPYQQNPYPQNPYPQNPYQQNPFPAPMSPQAGRYYAGQPQKAGTSGIKMFFVLFMIFSMFLAAAGLLTFKCASQNETFVYAEFNNAALSRSCWNQIQKNDGDIGDYPDYIEKYMGESTGFVVCHIVVLIIFVLVIILGVSALISGLMKSYSMAASLTAIGLFTLTAGYIAALIQALLYVIDDDRNGTRLGIMLPVMIAACLVMGIFACVSAKGMKNTGRHL